jgi:hypothetical protein
MLKKSFVLVPLLVAACSSSPTALPTEGKVAASSQAVLGTFDACFCRANLETLDCELRGVVDPALSELVANLPNFGHLDCRTTCGTMFASDFADGICLSIE